MSQQKILHSDTRNNDDQALSFHTRVKIIFVLVIYTIYSGLLICVSKAILDLNFISRSKKFS